MLSTSHRSGVTKISPFIWYRPRPGLKQCRLVRTPKVPPLCVNVCEWNIGHVWRILWLISSSSPSLRTETKQKLVKMVWHFHSLPHHVYVRRSGCVPSRVPTCVLCINALVFGQYSAVKWRYIGYCRENGLQKSPDTCFVIWLVVADSESTFFLLYYFVVITLTSCYKILLLLLIECKITALIKYFPKIDEDSDLSLWGIYDQHTSLYSVFHGAGFNGQDINWFLD